MTPKFLTALQTYDSAEPEGFFARLEVEVVYRFHEDAVCRLNVATQALFVAQERTDEAVTNAFRARDCAVLVWPYARANVAELVRMMGLSLPPLPTLDVRAALGCLPGYRLGGP